MAQSEPPDDHAWLFPHLARYPRLQTNIDKTARRMKALGYKVPQSVVRPNEYHFIHPETGVVDIIAKSTGSRTSTIVGVEELAK